VHASDITEVHRALAPAREMLLARDEDIVASQLEVTEIPAPTGDEGARARWIEAQFRALALDKVHIDAAGNVVGTRAGEHGDSAVVVCAHLDTVFPREAVGPARHEHGRIFAPGIGDNGRGLAALLALAHAIDGRTVRTRRPVRFVATTGEEGDGNLRGAKHHFAQHQAAAAVALDGTGDERVVHRAVGSRRFRVSIDGPGGHSWSDFGTANPLHTAAAAIDRLVTTALPEKPRTSLSVTRASAGLSVNSIPQTAWFEVDIRSTGQHPLAHLSAALDAIVGGAVSDANAARRPRSAPLSSTITLIGDRPCGELPVSEPLLEIACAATRLVGRLPELATASTDANIPLSLGIPSIAIGAGGLGGDVHTTGEWFENDAGARGIARALTIVVAAAR